jgi:hypothetical protein
MNTPGKLAVIAATAAAVAGLGGGTAMARSAGHAAPRPVVGGEPTSPDTDTLQRGDQTTPDTTAATAVTAVTAVHPAAVHGVTVHRAATTEADPPGDENGTETENPNDGPGGHEDPPGDVQHEGGNDEP